VFALFFFFEVSPYSPLWVCTSDCYDMEVGENRVRVFYGTEKGEKEKDWKYIQEALAPAVGPCIRPVTSCTSVTAIACVIRVIQYDQFNHCIHSI